MILFDNWTISNPDGLIGYQYDHKTRALMVSGNLPEGWSWDMLMDCGGQLDIIHLEPIDGGVATVLTAEQLSQDGYYTMQLRGAQGVAERHTNKIAVYIPGSLDGSAQWPEIPSEFTQLERRCRLLSEQAEQAAVRAETAAAGVQDISQQVQQVEASKRAAEQAAQDARDTAAGIHDVSDQVAQVEASKQAAQAAQSAAEQAAADTGADRQAVETAAGQVSADKGSIDQMVRQAGSLATQIRQDTQTNGQLAAQIAQDAQQAKADAASVAAAMPKLEAAVPAADRAETAQQAAETAKTNAEAAAQRAEAAAGSTTVDPTLANAGQAADAKAAGDAIRQLSTEKVGFEDFASSEKAGIVSPGDCLVVSNGKIGVNGEIIEESPANEVPFNLDEIRKNGCYLAATGEWLETPAFWSSPLLEIESEAVQIVVPPELVDAVGVHFTTWRADGTFHNGYLLKPTDGVYKAELTDGSVYHKIRIGFRSEVPYDAVKVFKGKDTSKKKYRLKVPVEDKIIVNGGKQWNQGKCVSFGTSITATNNVLDNGKPTGKYIPYLARLSGMLITNRGIAGGSINGHILYYLRFYKSDMKDALLITIEGAVNDYASAVPLGKVGDTVPYTNNLLPDGSPDGTFAGACYQCFKAAFENAPIATVVLLTEPTGRYIPSTGAHYDLAARNSLGLSQQDYIQMTIDVAKYVGVTVIPAGQNSSINEFNPQFYADHIHHSEMGGKQYASAVWSQLKNVPRKSIT